MLVDIRNTCCIYHPRAGNSGEKASSELPKPWVNSRPATKTPLRIAYSKPSTCGFAGRKKQAETTGERMEQGAATCLSTAHSPLTSMERTGRRRDRCRERFIRHMRMLAAWTVHRQALSSRIRCAICAGVHQCLARERPAGGENPVRIRTGATLFSAVQGTAAAPSSVTNP